MAGRLFWFAGGGTGGHLFPGIAVAHRLQERDPEARILFVGSDRPIESAILSRTPFEHQILTNSGPSGTRRRPFRRAAGLWRSYRAAAELVRRQPPALVVGCGGFASAAPVMAARRRRIPVVLLEQNVIPGRATRWLSRFADVVCLSFSETADRLPRGTNCEVTGNPVRGEIARLAVGGAETSGDRRTLLVLGGSQGARSVNELMTSFVADNRSSLAGWRIVHQTGQKYEDRAQESYAKLGVESTVAAFFDDPVALYRQADLAVVRAGGTTLAELACAQLPAIVVPYPHATADHQRHNADVFCDAGAAVLLREARDSPLPHDQFRTVLTSLLADDVKRTSMSEAMTRLARPDAADRVADLLLGRALPKDSDSP